MLPALPFEVELSFESIGRLVRLHMAIVSLVKPLRPLIVREGLVVIQCPFRLLILNARALGDSQDTANQRILVDIPMNDSGAAITKHLPYIRALHDLPPGSILSNLDSCLSRRPVISQKLLSRTALSRRE